MARARNIKPGFYKNEDLAECSVWARFIFPGLWMLADREGRLEDRPKRIKGELLPFDAQDVEPLLRELQARGFIERYQIDGGAYIQISKFSTHQSPHYSEKKSVIKPPNFLESEAHIEPSNSGKSPPIKRGSQPPDSLNPDSLNPDSLEKQSPQAAPPARKAKERASKIPEGFAVSERVGAWAEGKGFGELGRYLEFFVGRMKASGKTYVDWDQAFMNCIREDWPAFRGKGAVAPDYSRLTVEPQ